MGEAALGRVVTAGYVCEKQFPPFDFAQGRLFGDDNQEATATIKNNSRSLAGWANKKAMTAAG
jgi:hypothetical protein